MKMCVVRGNGQVNVITFLMDKRTLITCRKTHALNKYLLLMASMSEYKGKIRLIHSKVKFV